MSDTTTKKIVAFRVSWTADHEQYYPGHTTMFSDYTHSGNGYGETLQAAFDDAMEHLAQQGLDIAESMGGTFDAEALVELLTQVKKPEMLDWDIVRAKCPKQGEHYVPCVECGGNLPECEACEGIKIEDPEPDCAVCAGEWHFYVNVDVQVEDEPTYQVIVGNIGTVYSGPSFEDATKTYAEYVGQSRLGYGRASGESVTLMADGEIRQEHVGTVENC